MNPLKVRLSKLIVWDPEDNKEGYLIFVDRPKVLQIIDGILVSEGKVPLSSESKEKFPLIFSLLYAYGKCGVEDLSTPSGDFSSTLSGAIEVLSMNWSLSSKDPSVMALRKPSQYK